MLPTGVGDLPEQFLEIRRFRRRSFRDRVESWTAVFNGAENGRRLTRSLQNRFDDIRCGCLAVRAGDTYEMQTPGRMAVKISSDRRHGCPFVVDANPRNRGVRPLV